MNIILKLLLFLIPVAAIFALPFYVFYEAREFTDLNTVVEIQSVTPDTLFGLAYNNLDRAYKETLIAERKPEVVMLGTSRATQVRGAFFSAPLQFVNAGAAVSELDGMRRFVETLPMSTKLLIVSVDQQFFKPDRKRTPFEKVATDSSEAFLAGGWRKVYLDLFARKFTLRELKSARASLPHVGLNALVEGNGFLGDGSYYYGAVTSDPGRIQELEASVETVITQIRGNRSDFYYGDSIAEEQLAALRELLALCKERGIHTIGIIPPYAPALYEEVVSAEDEYAKIARMLPRTLENIFSEYEFSLFDYSNGRTVGIKDTEFIDPGHASDKAYLRILIDMARRSPESAAFVSIDHLLETLRETEGDFVYTLR